VKWGWRWINSVLKGYPKQALEIRDINSLAGASLEVSLQCKLKISWVARAYNSAKGRGAETSARIIEWRGVGDIENLRTKLQARAFRDPKRLSQHQIRIL
jgi:hypothetical protein